MRGLIELARELPPELCAPHPAFGHLLPACGRGEGLESRSRCWGVFLETCLVLQFYLDAQQSIDTIRR